MLIYGRSCLPWFHRLVRDALKNLTTVPGESVKNHENSGILKNPAENLSRPSTLAPLSEHFQSSFRALSEHFQSTFSAVFKLIQSDFRAVLEWSHFQCHLRAVSVQFQCSFSAVIETITSDFGAVLE